MVKILKSFSNLKPRAWLAIVGTLSVIERVLLYLFYRPVAYNDTASYRRLAEAIQHGWTSYDGTRMPGYPAFLALSGSDECVYAAQLALGFLTTLLFFYIGWRVSGKGWFGALAALAHTLNLQQLFFEANLITESLTTFFIAASLAGIAWLLLPSRCCAADSKRPLWQIVAVALASGLTGGLATLTRGLFIFLPFWAAFFLFIFPNRCCAWRTTARKIRWSAALATGLTGLLIIAAWVNFIHQRFEIWSVTTMSGYHLVQHTGLFFEYVPDEYAAIRDTYIQYRQARVAQTGAPGNAIWDAIPALQEVSGLGFIPLSNLLAKISIQLILEHPGLYLRSVLQGWLWFWKAPVYWSPEAFTNPLISMALAGKVAFARGGMVFANIAFIFGSLALVSKKVRLALKMDAFLWFAASTLWLTSILQTLLDHGDNPRFLVPMQSLVVFLVLWWGLQITRRVRKGKNENVSAE
ncbi:MAG: hypothetical protein QMD04_02830 [Anaerolineales bacterium]|nr:hypothetical protein [Anaerolineales bacterium]